VRGAPAPMQYEPFPSYVGRAWDEFVTSGWRAGAPSLAWHSTRSAWQQNSASAEAAVTLHGVDRASRCGLARSHCIGYRLPWRAQHAPTWAQPTRQRAAGACEHARRWGRPRGRREAPSTRVGPSRVYAKDDESGGTVLASGRLASVIAEQQCQPCASSEHGAARHSSWLLLPFRSGAGPEQPKCSLGRQSRWRRSSFPSVAMSSSYFLPSSTNSTS
jgi:hypothetical protein